MEAQKTYVTEIASLFPQQGDWTEAHYFALPETNRLVELSDGVLIMSPSPTRRHQQITARLHAQLDAYVGDKALGEVIIAPFDVRLWANKIRQPDLIFVRREHLSHIKDDRYYDGAPDWVAEVISPGTRDTDEQVKLEEYARAGIPEYWLIDPENATIRIYTLEGKAYTLAKTVSKGELAQSVTIAGFEVAIDRVFGRKAG
jgi:Uma2 family endonuclease